MLHLNPTTFTLWLGIIALAGIAVLCFVSWKRSPHPGRTAALEILRFFIALIVVLLLWQPEWRTVINPTTKPKIAILWDDSGSMKTLDATLPPELSDQSGEIVSRADWVEKALASGLWTPLRDGGKNDLITRPFATPSAEGLSGTDLDTPLSDLLEKENNLRAVVLLGDGDFNMGPPPVGAAQKYRLRGVPIFTIPVGSETRLPDLDLLTVTAPTYGIVGENVQIPFTIRSSLDRQVRTVVRLRDESGRERAKNIILPPNAETYDSILWRLEKEGSSTLTLSVPVEDGEVVSANNSRKFTISGRPEKINVLIVETLPRWEFRFLRNALQRDPGVALSCLLLRPGLGPAEGTDYIQKFPETLEELSKFDVVFLGDVGIAPDQLTAAQCARVRGLVENQASGVVFLPGPSATSPPSSKATSPISSPSPWMRRTRPVSPRLSPLRSISPRKAAPPFSPCLAIPRRRTLPSGAASPASSGTPLSSAPRAAPKSSPSMPTDADPTAPSPCSSRRPPAAGKSSSWA